MAFSLAWRVIFRTAFILGFCHTSLLEWTLSFVERVTCKFSECRYMFIAHILVSLRIPGLHKKSLIAITPKFNTIKRTQEGSSSWSFQFYHDLDLNHPSLAIKACDFLEAWYSQRDWNVGSKHITFQLSIYKSLAWFVILHSFCSFHFTGNSHAELWTVRQPVNKFSTYNAL